MLHYLKPSHYGLQVRRGQERFVDTEFRHRELFAYACEAYSRVVLLGDHKSRIAFVEKDARCGFFVSTGRDQRRGRTGPQRKPSSERLAAHQG